jgi:hypothetical protein
MTQRRFSKVAEREDSGISSPFDKLRVRKSNTLLILSLSKDENPIQLGVTVL